MPDLIPRPGLTTGAVVPCNRPGCSARIRWATTQANNVQPIDAQPHERGNLACRWDSEGCLRVRNLTTDRPWIEHDEWRAYPHHGSCANPPGRRARPDRRRRNGVRPVPQQRKP